MVPIIIIAPVTSFDCNRNVISYSIIFYNTNYRSAFAVSNLPTTSKISAIRPFFLKRSTAGTVSNIDRFLCGINLIDHNIDTAGIYD